MEVLKLGIGKTYLDEAGNEYGPMVIWNKASHKPFSTKPGFESAPIFSDTGIGHYSGETIRLVKEKPMIEFGKHYLLEDGSIVGPMVSAGADEDAAYVPGFKIPHLGCNQVWNLDGTVFQPTHGCAGHRVVKEYQPPAALEQTITATLKLDASDFSGALEELRYNVTAYAAELALAEKKVADARMSVRRERAKRREAQATTDFVINDNVELTEKNAKLAGSVANLERLLSSEMWRKDTLSGRMERALDNQHEQAKTICKQRRTIRKLVAALTAASGIGIFFAVFALTL